MKVGMDITSLYCIISCFSNTNMATVLISNVEATYS